MARIQVQKGQNSKKKIIEKEFPGYICTSIHILLKKKTYKGFWYSVQRFKKICLQIIKKNPNKNKNRGLYRTSISVIQKHKLPDL